MTYEYQTSGTCSKLITIEYDEKTHVVENITFLGGCPGNTIGVATLCKNKKLEEIINLLSGIKCGYKPTSCPDQLAKACLAILDSISK